jgi:MFS transporter, ACS family, hexuronate transporter
MIGDSDADRVRSVGRWVTTLLFLGSVVSYMDRAVLGVLMQQVRSDLALSNADYGIAVNCFLVAYALFYILGGRLADRFGYRHIVSLALGIWSLASAAHAAASGLLSLCALRALLGAAEGSFYPAAIRGITCWFPGPERAKGIGWLLAGICVGSLITPPLAAWASLTSGWRAAFLVTGLAGLLLLPAWLALHRNIHRSGTLRRPAALGRASQETALPAAATPLLAVLGSGRFWSAAGARALSDAAWFFYLFWLPGYFQAVHGFNPKMIGQYLWIPYGAAGLGAVAGPWIAGILIRRGSAPERARKTVLVVSAVCAAIGALSAFAGDAQALALICLALFAHQSWAANIHTVITEISPVEHAAVLYGITGATGTLIGAVSQPLIGFLVDRSGYTPAFLGAGSCYLIAAMLLVAGVRTIETITVRSRRQPA